MGELSENLVRGRPGPRSFFGRYATEGVGETEVGETWAVKADDRASLVAQWLRVRLLTQGTRVHAPVREDPTCRGAAGPVSHGR